MPSRIDEAGHTKAFDYPVAEHWEESQRTKRSLVGFEPTRAHSHPYESEIQLYHLRYPDPQSEARNLLQTRVARLQWTHVAPNRRA